MKNVIKIILMVIALIVQFYAMFSGKPYLFAVSLLCLWIALLIQD